MAGDGGRVGPAGPSAEKSVRVTKFEAEGDSGAVEFQQQIQMTKAFVRGLYKIAFELLCFQLGADYVLNSSFDLIRQYVRSGKGNRAIAVTIDSPIRPEVKPRLILAPGLDGGWLVEFRYGPTFLIDLTPDNLVAQRADSEMLKQRNLRLWWDNEASRSR